FEDFVGALPADPETADWYRDKGDDRQLRRAWDRAGSGPDNLPMITVVAGLRHEAADAGIAALHKAGVPLYQRDKSLVRVCMVAAKTAHGEITYTPGIIDVGHAYLSRALGRVARWEVLDRHGDSIRVDPPRPIVEQIADMAGEWPFNVLTGVTGTPTMR